MIFHKERNIGVFKLDILSELSPNFTFHFLCETKLLNTITVSEFFNIFNTGFEGDKNEKKRKQKELEN